MAKTVTEKINKFLVGEEEDKKKKLPPWLKKDKDDEDDEKDDVSEGQLEASTGLKAGEYNNLSTGLRRIAFRLEKANTPQKYVDAFEVIKQLVDRFPLKSKVIWQAVASAYDIRFGAASAPAEMANVAPEE